MERQPFPIFDLSAVVPSLSVYRFCVTAAGATSTINGFFRNRYGLKEGPPFSTTLAADTVYSFEELAAGLASNFKGACEAVVFDHSADLSYLIVKEGEIISASDIRKGPTWEAMNNRAVGRNG